MEFKLSSTALTVIYPNGNVDTLSETFPRFNMIANAVKKGNLQAAEKFFVDGSYEAMQTGVWDDLKLEVTKEAIFYLLAPDTRVQVPEVMREWFLSLQTRLGFQGVERFAKFISNLMQNPNYNSRQQLWSFMQHSANKASGGLAIDEHGHIVAYKTIRQDGMDKHSGTVRWDVEGSTVTMDRDLVDDDPNSHCSAGLHVGSIGYTRWFGSSNGRLFLVSVNPKDVVSVPNDHEAQKVRACAVTVLKEVPKNLQVILRSAAYTGEVEGEVNTPTLWDAADEYQLWADYDDDYDTEYEW